MTSLYEDDLKDKGNPKAKKDLAKLKHPQKMKTISK